ncbi:hypothetical protein ADUPG1_000746, partial [Aduncisulcus paluster]
LTGEPSGKPVLGVSKSEAVWMYFLTHDTTLHFFYYDGYMAGALANAIRTTHSPGLNSLPGRTFVNFDDVYAERVNIHSGNLLGVSHCRVKHFTEHFSTLLGVNFRMLRASSTGFPLMFSATKRTFLGEMRIYFAIALASIAQHLLAFGLAFLICSVAVVGTGGRKFAQLVSYHVF